MQNASRIGTGRVLLVGGKFGFAQKTSKKRLTNRFSHSIMTTARQEKTEMWLYKFNIEMWLSLVERCVRDAEAAGSNPVISTK